LKVNDDVYRAYESVVALASEMQWQNISTIVPLNTGDFVEMGGYQSSGGPLNTSPYVGIAPTLRVQWMSP
jgi:hypothetical protein